MQDNYKILESNPSLTLLDGVYRYPSPTYRDSDLTSYIQRTLSGIFGSNLNLCMFSLDMEQACNTTELRHAIPPQKSNYIRLLNLHSDMSVLDLSPDFGGTSHYIADKVASVESIQADSGHAELARLRCRDKNNVIHIAEDIFEITLPNKHYDLIILGDIDAYAVEPDVLGRLLKKIKAALNDTGNIILNSLNSNRLSKTFDAQSVDFESTLPFVDLYNTGFGISPEDPDETNIAKAQGQSRKQLRRQLFAAGFNSCNLYASFGQLTDCSNLFSENYLSTNNNVLNHCYRLGSINNPSINEYLLYKTCLRQHQQLSDLATRYTVIASTNTAHNQTLYDNDFAYFPGSGRQTHWRTVTKRERGTATVVKQHTHGQYTNDSTLIKQNLTPQPFIDGKILVDDWLQAMLDQDETRFEGLVKEYSDWLKQKETEKSFTQTAYDMLPFNILVNVKNEQREYLTIDPEWQINANFDADFVLFRALFWFAFENKTIVKPYSEKFNLFSIGTFVLRFMPAHNIIDEFDSYIQLEERIQQQIDQNFRVNAIRNAITQTFNEHSDNTQTKPYLQISWGNKENQFDESNALSLDWSSTDGEQTFESELPVNPNDYTVLRIDPIARKGTFRFDYFKLVDQDGHEILQLDSCFAINDSVKVNNATLSKEIFIALSDDPHFLFDLSTLPKSKINAAKVVVSVQWLWDEGYSDVIDTLNDIITRQNSALFSQKHNVNQLSAENHFHKVHIKELIRQRNSVDQQAAQIGQKNNELHALMLMRPTTRIKSLMSRVISRVLNKFDKNHNESNNGKLIEDSPMDDGSVENDTTIPDQPEDTLNAQQADQDVDVSELINQNQEDYTLWLKQHTLDDTQIKDALTEIESMPYKPLISIVVPVYNTDPKYLVAMIQSVQAQIYTNWELCLVDDCSPNTYLRDLLEFEAYKDSRIKVQLNDVNQGIATASNDALAIASGDYVALLDHDDEISIDALYQNAKVINESPSVGLIYSDEDKLDMEGNRLEPFFKPDYSPDYLDTNNYICHFTVIKKSIVDQIGGFRSGLDGSQDHDIILRAIAQTDKVVHIPRILYHWRKIPGSTAAAYDSKSYAWEAGRKAVEDSLIKKEDGVRVEFGTLKGTYRVHREIKNTPLVSIIIPFKDKPELLESCINSIIQKSTYENFEIVGVSNNSDEKATFDIMEHFKELDSRIWFVEKNIPFNFSAICNYGVEQSNGDYVLLLNNDIEIINNDWIERLLEYAQRPGTGVVGGKLLYPDGRIQHAGVVVGMVGTAGHPHKFFPDKHIGYHGRLHMVYNVSAITGAMMLVSKEKFKQVGGLDENNLAIAYNDIDLCLKFLDANYCNVFTPHSVAIHHESISRGYEDTDEKLHRLKTEQAFFLEKWADFIEQGDPYYNPNLSLKNEAFSLNFKSD